jgi:hypothetical protein
MLISVAKSATRLPGGGNSRAFTAPAGTDLVPLAVAAFTASGTLLDLGAADFAASVGWLPQGQQPSQSRATSSTWPQAA